jgi:uncharacterized damage-inducible protein DinB
MKEQLLETWRINHRMNLLVINNTTDTGMEKSLSARGGRTIFQQWVHIHNVRMQWLEVCAKDIFARYKVLDKWSMIKKLCSKHWKIPLKG